MRYLVKGTQMKEIARFIITQVGIPSLVLMERAALGVAGEAAEERRLQNGTGNATFRNDLIDAVFNLTETQLTQGVRYEIYQG